MFQDKECICRCAQGAKSALESLPKIWPPDAHIASAAALGQIKICSAGVSIKVFATHCKSQGCTLAGTAAIIY